MHVLFELASGYSLFETDGIEDVGRNLSQVQQDVLDISKFGKVVSVKSFLPFKSSAAALENINSVSEGLLHPTLKSFLEMNLPKTGKKSKVVLGVADKGLATSIKQELGLECLSDDFVLEVVRGLRMHADKLLRQLKGHDIEKTQLGLGHSYSRGKVRFNVNRSDNMIIQAIALVDQLDKDINLFSMRIREWYSWHFPELIKIVPDNAMYARLAILIRHRSALSNDMLDQLTEVTQDSTKSRQILDAARISMGTDISEIDMINIDHFARKLISLTEYRQQLGAYLQDRMHTVAPNLSSLIGETVGARLISRAGSLTNLAKFPASTVQILGAEKALFRALKTRGKTPKYGLIFHSSFIGKAGAKCKGRISRLLANKCSIASRLDCFSDVPSAAFGDALKHQVEERLTYYENGKTPTSNAQVMQSVIQQQKMLSPVTKASKDTSSSKKASADGTGDKRKRKLPEAKEEDQEMLSVEKKKQKREEQPGKGEVRKVNTQVMKEPQEVPKPSKKEKKQEEKKDERRGDESKKDAKKEKKEKKKGKGE